MRHYRTTQLLACLTCVTLLAFAYYLEFYRHILPCPLCLLQRGVFLALALFFLIGALIYGNRIWRRLLNSITFIIASLGMILAGRQVWLETYPPKHFQGCGADISYMLKYMPWQESLKKIFAGSPECGLHTWSLFNLDIAEWSFLCFCGFALLSLLQLRKA